MAKSDKKSSTSIFVTGYLLIYNLCAAFGWAYVLSICVKHIAAKSTDTLWPEIETSLKIFQTMACLEILHSILGLVKSPWFTTFMQVFSRVWTLWAVMNVAPPAQTSIFLTFACTSWALVEVPRYLYYAFNLVGFVPYPIFWLRYSLFAVLYPSGITGELGCMYMAAKYLWETNVSMYETVPMPTMLPLFAGIIIVSLTYIPGSPQMYGHMLKTRNKQFANLKSGKKLE